MSVIEQLTIQLWPLSMPGGMSRYTEMRLASIQMILGSEINLVPRVLTGIQTHDTSAQSSMRLACSNVVVDSSSSDLFISGQWETWVLVRYMRYPRA